MFVQTQFQRVIFPKTDNILHSKGVLTVAFDVKSSLNMI